MLVYQRVDLHYHCISLFSLSFWLLSFPFWSMVTMTFCDSKTLTGWWFQTFLFFIIYGMSSFSLTHMFLFFKMFKTTFSHFFSSIHRNLGHGRVDPGTTTATAPWTPRSWLWNICCAWRTYISPWKSCGRGWKSWRKARPTGPGRGQGPGARGLGSG